jgi:hypothetical protein
MSMNRRGFLAAIGQLATSAVLPADSTGLLIKALSGNGSGDTVIALLTRRQELLTDSEDGYDLQNLGDWLRDEVNDIENRYLSRVNWDASLLSPEEAKGMNGDLQGAVREYRAHAEAINKELGQIDGALWENRDSVRRVVAPQQQYYETEAAIGSLKTPAAQKRALEHQLGRMQAPELDVSTIDDVSHVIEGAKAPCLDSARQTSASALGDVRQVTQEVARAASAPRNKDWQERRRQALSSHVRELLIRIAGSPYVSVESTLDKGYGNDGWHIATSFDKNAADVERKMLGTEMEELHHCISLIYPERTKEQDTEFLQLATPGQPGYGEHSYQRLSIINPDFGLREMLKDAKKTNLQRDNQQGHAVRTLAR